MAVVRTYADQVDKLIDKLEDLISEKDALYDRVDALKAEADALRTEADSLVRIQFDRKTVHPVWPYVPSPAVQLTQWSDVSKAHARLLRQSAQKEGEALKVAKSAVEVKDKIFKVKSAIRRLA